MNIGEKKERRIAWTMLVLCPLSMALMFIYVTLEMAPGLDAGHPMIYLQLTCVLWAIVMMIVPVLRLLRFVALPLWFSAILYADMYMYVISLCLGMYMNYYWWANFTHVISTMAVAAIVLLALCKITTDAPPHVSLGSNGGIIVMMFFMAAAFGAIWEFSEGMTDLLSGYDYMIYGAIDNVGNLAADIVGVIIMVPIARVLLSRYGAKGIASAFRVGRKDIDAGG
jgi:hypothetical protein